MSDQDDAEQQLRALAVGDAIVFSANELPAYETAAIALHEEGGIAINFKPEPGCSAWRATRLQDTGAYAALRGKSGEEGCPAASPS